MLLREAGPATRPYDEQIVVMLDSLAQLNCRSAHNVVCSMVESYLAALTQPVLISRDFRRQQLDQPVEVYLPVRVSWPLTLDAQHACTQHWGEVFDSQTFVSRWRQPDHNDWAQVQRLCDVLLWPYLHKLDTSTNNMSK
jgi:hypothetical protein